MVKQQKTSSSRPIGNRRIRGFRASAQSGQAIVIMALAMVGLIAFVGLAIDGGRYFEQRRASQNASDMAALGGLFVYSKASDPTTVKDQDVLKEINRIAEINLIKDTDGTAGNAVNTNVMAWWVDKDGNDIRQIENDATKKAPSDTRAVRVFTQIPYQTFFAGMFGWSSMRAESVGIARIHFTSTPPDPVLDTSAWVGGSTCDNLTDRIAHNYSNTNTAHFKSKIYIDGSLAVGAVNSSDFDGNVEVRVVSGEGSIDGPYSAVSPANDDPFAGGGNKYNNGAQYIAPSGKGSRGMPPWAHEGMDPTKPLIDAMSFKPGTGYWYKKHESVLGTAAANNFYHTISPANVAGVEAAYAAGKRGVYWIDGDLTVTAGSTWWNGVTLITTGTFESQDSNHEFSSAGPLASNISVLAGKDRGGAARCASNMSNWVFKVGANRNVFHGLIYVPYGQIYLEGNTTGGSVDFSKGIITYSLYLGSDQQGANSWQFNFDPDLPVQPALTTELNK
jgi:hypothetical protein